MKYIVGYDLSSHDCHDDYNSDEEFVSECSKRCYDKVAFLSVDETLPPGETKFTIHITSNISARTIDFNLLFAKDSTYEIENLINEYPGYNFTIHHIMKTETNECCDVEYKPLLTAIKKREKYGRHLVSKLKSAYKIESYIKSFRVLISILTS